MRKIWEPNPDQPERCPSMDPYNSGLQCARKIHEDDQCQYGGIGWKKGTPRYISAEEKIGLIKTLIGDPDIEDLDDFVRNLQMILDMPE